MPATPHDGQIAEQHLAFICTKCKIPILQFTCYGFHRDPFTGKHGSQYLVRCHGAQQTITVDSIPPVGIKQVECFAGPVTDGWGTTLIQKITGKQADPKLRFYCEKCDFVSKEFEWQRDEHGETVVFIITCRGERCQGHRHALTITANALKQADAWNASPPILVPMSKPQAKGTAIGSLGLAPKTPPKPAAPAKPAPPPKPAGIRKLRIE